MTIHCSMAIQNELATKIINMEVTLESASTGASAKWVQRGATWCNVV